MGSRGDVSAGNGGIFRISSWAIMGNVRLTPPPPKSQPTPTRKVQALLRDYSAKNNESSENRAGDFPWKKRVALGGWIPHEFMTAHDSSVIEATPPTSQGSPSFSRDSASLFLIRSAASLFYPKHHIVHLQNSERKNKRTNKKTHAEFLQFSTFLFFIFI